MPDPIRHPAIGNLIALTVEQQRCRIAWPEPGV